MVVIGVDIGGTKTHAVAFGHHFQQLAEIRVPTVVGSGDSVTSSTIEAIKTLTDDFGIGRVDRIGLGIPGRVDSSTGCVNRAVNLGIGAEPVPIAAAVAASCGAPCRLENDVNVAALGAFQILQRSEELTDLTYLSIGTGIAAGLVLRGRIHRGSHGVAGEIGHLPIVADGDRCRCGLRGCFETVASGAAIARQWPVAEGESAALALLTAAASGDERAIAVLGPISDQLAMAVYLLALTFDVDRIVIGGGVAETGQMLVDAVLVSVEQLSVQSNFVRSLDLSKRIRLAPPGPIGAIGAAVMTDENVL